MSSRPRFVSIVNWNVEWCRSDSRAADQLRERIWESDPDIVCLTEAYTDFLDRSAHVIEADPDYGYRVTEGRRKVLLWSKQPWRDVDQVGHPTLPTGRFVRGCTRTPLGPVDVIGVCIPWSGAHVTTGQRNRQRWEDHVTYLQGLSHLIPSDAGNLIVVGDYNQRIPRSVAPDAVYQALNDALLQRLETPTAGFVAPLNVQLIDHLSHSRDLNALAVRTLSNVGAKGKALTDHVGVRLVLCRPEATAELIASITGSALGRRAATGQWLWTSDGAS